MANSPIDKFVNRYSGTHRKSSHSSMKLRSHPQIQFSAVWLLGLNTVRKTSIDITVHSGLEVRTKLGNRLSLIKNQVITHADHLPEKTVIFTAVFHRTLVTLVFQIIHNIKCNRYSSSASKWLSSSMLSCKHTKVGTNKQTFRQLFSKPTRFSRFY